MDITVFLLAALAGALTTLSPCVLPVLPLVLATALRGGRRGPLYFGAGLLISFVGLTWTLSRFGTVLGLEPDILRKVTGVILIAAGILFISEKAQGLLTALLAPLLRRVEKASRQTLGDGEEVPPAWRFMLLGALTGLLWTPCSGPSLGVALGLAAERETAGQALGLLLVFGVGALVPLLAVAYGSQALTNRLKAASRRSSSVVKLTLGVLIVLLGVAVLTGGDKIIEAWLVGHSPEWLVDWTTKF